MSQISLKSISGITSITTPTGVDNQFTLHTNNTTEVMRVTSSGLNVTGVITATSFSGIDTDKISEGNTEAEVVDTGSDGHFKVKTEGSERLRIDSSGRVMIGTTDPTTSTNADDLTIHTSGHSGITIRSGTSSDGSIFFADATSGSGRYKGIIKYDHSSDEMVFATNDTERFYISNTGVIRPRNDGTQDLGTSSKRFGNFYAATLYGNGANLTGINADLVNDTSPQLGGDLASNGQDILFANNDKLKFGTGNDAAIFHNDTDFVIDAQDSGATRNIYIDAGTVNEGGIYLRSAAGDTMFKALTDANCFLYYDNSLKLRTMTDGIENRGHSYPEADNTHDLGKTSLRWRNIYTNDLNLSNKGSANSIDNTWGDYTIQEGESDLFLINNRNGKKYQFMLKEIP